MSASQRFVLWLDGVEIAAGPSRADRGQWGIVPVRLTELPAGDHLVAVEVTHWGCHAGKGQVGGPGFLLFAGAAISWRCGLDPSRSPHCTPARLKLSGHRAIGAGEAFHAEEHPWGWREASFDDRGWMLPASWPEPPGNRWGNRLGGLSLVEEPLPPMKRTAWPWKRHTKVGAIAPHRTESWVLDAGVVLNAIPLVRWSGGHGAEIVLTWCEAPVHPHSGKGDRDRLEGCVFPGQEDLLRPDGGDDRSWSPPWIRSFRYLHIEIQTGEDPLEWQGVTLERESFPLEPSMKVEIADPEARPWARLRQVSLDTALACSHETFFDCPAWEQAQFPGDARIQSRHHYLMAGEERLAVKAIRDLSAAKVPGGLLRSHAPSSFEQVIATYSLHWIGMLHDLRIYRGRADAIAPHLPQARAILEWFLARRREDGLLALIEEPLFFDWAQGFLAGCAPQGTDGGSTATAALLAEACGWMEQLELFAGRPAFSGEWGREAALLRSSLERCWDPARGLLADWPGAGSFSVHAQVQATLAGFWQADQAAPILQRALKDPTVTQPGTLYYRAHLAEALRRSGQPAGVWDLLPCWFSMLEGTGLTTWPESDSNPRSDCHGWGAMPDIELAHSLLGCSPDPDTAGWSRCLFDPSPGTLDRLSGEIPHPLGRLAVTLIRDGEGYAVTLETPAETLVMRSGIRLPPGTHEFRVDAAAISLPPEARFGSGDGLSD